MYYRINHKSVQKIGVNSDNDELVLVINDKEFIYRILDVINILVNDDNQNIIIIKLFTHKLIQYHLAFVNKDETELFINDYNKVLLKRSFRPKYIAILLNPMAGVKKGRKILKKACEIFDASEVKYDITETEYANYGVEYARKLDLTLYDCIVCVSGDSTLTEVYEGLSTRDDCKESTKLPIGLIAAGSSNAIIESFGATDPIEAAKRIIAGIVTLMDTFQVEFIDSKTNRVTFNRIGLVDFGFGFMGDANAEAENCRCFGPIRYDLASVKKAFGCNKVYNCSFKYKGNRVVKTQCRANCKTCGEQLEKSDKFIEHDNKNWCTIFGVLTPKLTASMKFTPYAHMGDGLMDVLAVEQLGTCEIIQFLLGLPKEKHIESSKVNYLQCSEFQLFNIGSIHSRLNIDGEVYEIPSEKTAVVHVKMNQQNITFLGGFA